MRCREANPRYFWFEDANRRSPTICGKCRKQVRDNVPPDYRTEKECTCITDGKMTRARTITDAEMQQIAEQLIGQCMADQDDICSELGLPLMGDWTQADCLALDELAFVCSKCGWWVAGDEHAEIEEDEFVCYECGEDDDG